MAQANYTEMEIEFPNYITPFGHRKCTTFQLINGGGEHSTQLRRTHKIREKCGVKTK